MSIGFVHLSDIHFGQESGGTVLIHDDVKEQLIEDVRCVVGTLKSGHAAGIIVTGDIAYGGRTCEYKTAAKWLDQVASAAGCAISDIQIVPGNHDIDWDEISPATKIMLRTINAGGEPELDQFLASDEDRDLLFRRFSAYRSFAQGYRCSLDINAVPTEQRVMKLSPGRVIRFVRLNSALVCSKNDKKGDLLLGARQRVLKRRSGEELVVLSHHPLDWFQDSEDARLFFRSRARVFISGHEHKPSVKIEETDQCGTLMMLSAGAAVPPASDGSFDYCYNLIEFECETGEDALSVNVVPRIWINELKRFGADEGLLNGGAQSHVLTCTNWRSSSGDKTKNESVQREYRLDIVIDGSGQDRRLNPKEAKLNDDYSLLLLRFFRDISRDRRLKILVKLDAIPSDWSGTLSEAFERMAFDKLVESGRLDELRNLINRELCT